MVQYSVFRFTEPFLDQRGHAPWIFQIYYYVYIYIYIFVLKDWNKNKNYLVFQNSKLAFSEWKLAQRIQKKKKKMVIWPICVWHANLLAWCLKPKVWDFDFKWCCVVHLLVHLEGLFRCFLFLIFLFVGLGVFCFYFATQIWFLVRKILDT